MALTTHGGDLGDSVVSLGILAQLHGGPHELILTQSRGTRMRTIGDVLNWKRLLQPLAEAQSYIKEVRLFKPKEKVWWASEGFRHSGLHPKNCSLFAAQLSHLVHTKQWQLCTISSAVKWLTVEPKQFEGRVIVARSERYQNPSFPWRRVVNHYGRRLLFIGLPDEHKEFQQEYGEIEYRPVKDLLDMAQVVAGSALFIGNQSAPMTVAEGLKHPTIQETSLKTPDCIYYRSNAQWVENGRCVLPAIEDTPELKIEPIRSEWPAAHAMQEYCQRHFGDVETARLLAGYPQRTVKEML